MTQHEIDKNKQVGHVISARDSAKVEVGDIDITNITGLRSQDLNRFIKRLFLVINRQDKKATDAYIDSIKSLSSLDSETNELIELLTFKSKLSFNKNVELDRESLLDLLKSPEPSPFIKDVIESIHLHYLSAVDKKRAKERFEKSPYIGKYSLAIYWENIANLDTLETELSAGLSDKSEIELSALARGSLRCKNFQLAIAFSTELDSNYSNLNSKVLFLLSKSYALHDSIGGQHIWIVSHQKVLELLESTEQCIELWGSSSDPRIIQASAILLLCYWCQREDLASICRQDMTEAEKVAPAISDLLNRDVSDPRKLQSAKEILGNTQLVIDGDSINHILEALQQGIVSSRDLKKWQNEGGMINLGNESHTQFASILLDSFVCDNTDQMRVEELINEIESFRKNNKGKIHELNPLALHQLAENLQALDKHSAIVGLLSPIIPRTPWNSPLVETYAEALLHSDQLVKLESLFKDLKCIGNTFKVEVLRAERLVALENFEQAIYIISSLIHENDKSCYLWASLIRMRILANDSLSIIADEISAIPREILEEYSDDGLRLVQLAAKADIQFSESVILEWFIDDPVAMSIHVTNLHLSNLENCHMESEPIPSSGRCSQAVVYKQNGKVMTKLLVDNGPTNEYSVDINSPLGEELQRAEKGHKFLMPLGEFEVLEVIPPIVGAFRISAGIRNDVNQGNDCFYKFTTDGSIDDILDKVDKFIQRKELIEPQLNGVQVPLLMRLKATHSSNLMKGCFQYLTDVESNQHLSLYSEGKTEPSQLILDVATLSYLSLTNLGNGLSNLGAKLYVTRETYHIVSQWLEQILAPEYLSLGKLDNDFYKTTSDDIANDNSIINLKEFLGRCEIISPRELDVPETVMKLRDIIDISHYSSVKASLSHSIPVLCIDPIMCTYYRSLNIDLVNVYELMIKAISSNPSKDKKHIECHVAYEIPVPIMYRDIIELAKQSGVKQYVVARILRMYPSTYQSEEIALTILSECFLKSLCSAYLGNPKDISLSDWCYTPYVINSCCYSAMQYLDGDSSESKLAKLIAKILKKTNGVSDLRNISLAFISRFANGQFLDINQLNEEVKMILQQ